MTLDAFRRLLGDAHVIADDRTAAASTATFATTARVLGIVQPADVAEVQACVRLARELGTPLYPTSRGTNWGYGSRVPPVADAFLLDLSRMNRITDFDEDLGYMTVEPGVTFRQAFEFLRSRSSNLLLNTIGGSPDSSLVGNVMERGIAKGPLGDRAAHACNLQVVTGNGELVHTGLGRFGDAHAAPLYRWGLGPSLDGLFSQSGMGVVTRMTQWLMPRPAYFQLLFYQLEHDRDVPRIIGALRQLLMTGALRPTLTLYNDYRVMGVVSRYPFERANGVTPLPDALRLAMRAELPASGFGGGAWSGDIAIYSPSEEIGRATRRLVEQTLEGKVRDLVAFEADAEAIDAAFRMTTADSWSGALVRNFLGAPSDHAIDSVYWRKPQPAPSDPDPDRDRCGLLWCGPVVPFRADDVAEVTGFMERTMKEHGFEPGLTIQCLTERAVYVIGSINYDRDAPGDDERALACYHHLVDELARRGYPPYRLATPSMAVDGLRARDDSADVIARVTRALDPAGILAPGRYRVR